MRDADVDMETIDRRLLSPGVPSCILACWLGVVGPRAAAADPSVFEPTATTPDAPARVGPPRLSPTTFRPSWDLDGIYLWLGPSGAASWTDAHWDSTFGADATVVSVREGAALGVVGASLGASRWTVRGGGRMWFDTLVGTQVLGRMVGVSAGPLLELSDLAHPRSGGSIGLWGFVGVTPFARVGFVDKLGGFAEIGVHIALPVVRR
jgi:hypothetical protein